KTSTFALAVMNVWAAVRGRPHIELGHREVPAESVQRAFAIIALSLAALMLGIFALSWLEPDKDLTDLSFECVSAYSTSGLSLGITSSLGTGSKWVLIALMFTGRVGTLNLLTGMLQQIHRAHYRYPQESVLIN
ncbi:MAG TPA: potassium transporter TrkG, partial [Saprospiraceae bacterium]|nr:potassium transporter TrkG [Saprospiraceae bacterium]